MKPGIIYLFVLLISFGCKDNRPRVATATCNFVADASDGDIRCGYMTVPENHEKPDGRKIQLTYVVIGASNGKTSKYPMIYFSGGPGRRTLTKRIVSKWAKSEYAKHRDLILFDQRGVNLSSPLPDLGPDLFAILAKDANMEEEKEMFRRAAKRYKAKCDQLGIDLSQYNSFESSKDVKALMDYLGYKKYNLFGSSYGSRLARVMQDLYPEKINTVILDSPTVLNTDFLKMRIESYALALERVLTLCERDPLCANKYPDLRNRYLQSVISFNSRPFKLTIENLGDFHLNAQDAIFMTRKFLYGENAPWQAPRFIQALSERNPEIITEVIKGDWKVYNGQINISMLLSVEGFEQFDAEFTPEDIESMYKRQPLFPEKLGLWTSLYATRDLWQHGRLKEEERQFKKSQVPTLILINNYDPVTPPENGKILEEQLSNSSVFIMDQGGHGAVKGACTKRLINDFMDTGDISGCDVSCLKLYQAQTL